MDSLLMVNAYDMSMDYQITMYDNLPYERNADECNSSHVMLYSGNVVKYYVCSVGDELPISNMDDEIELRLQEIARLEANRTAKPVVKVEDTEQTDGITPEQMENLLHDTEEEIEEEKKEKEDDGLPSFADMNF